MKRFILHTLTILALAAIIILALTWHIASTLSRADFTLPDSVHIITLGPSTTACALDDEYLEGMKNISKHGIYLPQLIPLLPQLLDENKQIDTVYINFGRCPIFLHTKYRNIPEVETRGSINYQLRFYYYDFQNTDWKGYARNPDFYLSLLTPDFWDLVKARKPRNLTDYEFGYTNVSYANLHKPEIDWSIEWYARTTAERGGNTYSRQWIQDNCAPIDRAARAAIDICRARDVTPILFFTPLYQYDRWVAPAPFREYMATFPPDILIADYEDFTFPDDTYYGDVHHLNLHGAHYFTTHLARHGIRAIPLSQWLTAPSPTN